MSGIADETLWNAAVGFYDATTFTRIINYSVAHELAHLAINPAGAGGWTPDENILQGGNALMASPAVQNLDVVQFIDMEIESINLGERTSIKP